MVELSLPSPWPAAALALLFGAACASTGSHAPAGGAPAPSASAASLAPADLLAPAATPIAEADNAPPPNAAPAPPPPPEPRRGDPHCARGGPAPMRCVAASETEGEPVTSSSAGGAEVCRSAPKGGVCGGCRALFVKLEKGQCCYRGLSRFPRCKKLPPDDG